MKSLRTVSMVSLVLTYTACMAEKQEPASKLEENDSTLESTSPDLPSIGRSLFDHMMAIRQGEEWLIDIPFPFEELSRKIFREGESGPFGAKAVRRTSALIPRGRSLQRHSNTDDRFALPRVIMGFDKQYATLNPLPANEKVKSVLGGRIYVAYSEPAKQLEIISYNEAMGRFEFQVVHDYGPPPSVPKLRYARRSLCLSCHQNEGPIFSNALWAETNDNPAIATLIGRAHPGKTTYQGVPIESQISSSGSVNSLDQSIREANLIVPHQVVWAKGCDGEREEAIRCRGTILKRAFAYVWGSFTQTPSPTNWTTNWQQLANSALRTTSRLPDIASLQIPGPNGSIRALKAEMTEPQIQNVKNLILATSDSSGEFDPLTVRASKDTENSNGVAAQFLSSSGGGFGKIAVFVGNAIESDAHQQIRISANQDLVTLNAAIDAIAEKTISHQSTVLDERPFSGGDVAAALMAELRPNEQHGFCCGEEHPPFPPALLDSDGEPQGSDPRLVPFKKYCAACHSGSGQLAFMTGDDQAVLSKLRARAQSISARLQWETPGTVAMPPANSTQYAELNEPENAAARLQMIVTVKADE